MNVGDDTVVLGIETSCDETAAAVVVGGREIASSVVSSQIDLHAEFGGVVPEIAGRAHEQTLIPAVAQALVESGLEGSQVDAVAATVGPGLIGSLLVGVSAAKALALVWDVPFVGVNHLEGHLHAAFLEDPSVELPIVGEALQNGTLRTILPDYRPSDLMLAAMYPRHRHLSAKVRLFIDMLDERFGGRPYWDLVQ